MNKTYCLIASFLFVMASCNNIQSDNEFLRQISRGKQHYVTHCAGCHGDNGEGLANLIPPLAGSDYMLSNWTRTAHIIKYGQNGPIEVKGKTYNLPMPENKILKNNDIVDLINFLGNVWGHKAGKIQLDSINTGLIQHK